MYGGLPLESKCFVLHARDMNRTLSYDSYETACREKGGKLAVIEDLQTWIKMTYWLQTIKSTAFR